MSRVTQADEILSLLRAHYPCALTTKQLRDRTGIENVTGRLNDLEQAGWQIDTVTTVSDRDGTALYKLESLTPRSARVKDWSIEAYRDNSKGLVCRIQPTGLSDKYSEEALARLQAAVQLATETWEWEEAGCPGRVTEVDTMDYLLADCW